MSRGSTTSAGLLLYRMPAGRLEVLIAHMGGPFWARKEQGAWSLIKGEVNPDEEPFAAARREFAEETGSVAPQGPAVPLGDVVQASGKRVIAWAIHSDFDPATVNSVTFTAEWPPRSGRMQAFPEIERAEWCAPEIARHRLVRAQRAFVDRLEAYLSPSA